MGTYFTDIAVGAPADAATFNAPLDELDAQLVLHNTEIVNARGSLGSIDARLDVSLNENGTVRGNAITAQSQINIGDAAAVNGDAVRYQEYVAHTHSSDFINIFSRRSESAATDTDAAAIDHFIRTDVNSNLVYFIRTAHWKRANVNALYLTGWKSNTSATLEGTIRLTCGAETADEAVATGIGATNFSLALDISALNNNESHNVTVIMRYAGGVGGATGQITLGNAQIWAYRTAAAPA